MRQNVGSFDKCSSREAEKILVGPPMSTQHPPHKSCPISSKASSCKTCLRASTICCLHLFRRRCHSVIHLGHRCSAWQSETRTTYSMHENVPTSPAAADRALEPLVATLFAPYKLLGLPTSVSICCSFFSSFHECLPLFPDLDWIVPLFSISKPDQKFSVTCRGLHAGSDRQTDGRKEGRHDAIRKAMDKLFCVCPFRI